MAKKSWHEKLNNPAPPQIKPVPTNMAGMKEGQLMLIPTPRMIDAFVRSLPNGEGLDMPGLRGALASQEGAEVTCPITTGIHLRTVAEAAYERHLQGAPLADITPFWRVMDKKTPVTKKLACGVDFVTAQREREGLAP
ncbi:MAG: hypothetical protein AAFW76_06430 [Pseudomonadota bacterium]